jgi:hypothetical protein
MADAEHPMSPKADAPQPAASPMTSAQIASQADVTMVRKQNTNPCGLSVYD